MKTILDAALRLFLVCAIAAGTLAFVYRGTQARIAENKALERTSRLRWVLPDCTEIESRGTDGEEWFAGFSEGRACGYAVETRTKGYGGVMTLLVGVDLEGRVAGFSILSHKETPGLGDKAGKPAFGEQFKGKDAAGLVLKKDSVDGGIDALTAATVTSRAVTRGIREGLERVASLRAKEGHGR
ncbi:MAG: RnfABCDGE type electron transport complex subunit G [Elusimicrobiota bacterium]